MSALGQLPEFLFSQSIPRGFRVIVSVIPVSPIVCGVHETTKRTPGNLTHVDHCIHGCCTFPVRIERDKSKQRQNTTKPIEH